MYSRNCSCGVPLPPVTSCISCLLVATVFNSSASGSRKPLFICSIWESAISAVFRWKSFIGPDICLRRSVIFCTNSAWRESRILSAFLNASSACFLYSSAVNPVSSTVIAFVALSFFSRSAAACIQWAASFRRLASWVSVLGLCLPVVGRIAPAFDGNHGSRAASESNPRVPSLIASPILLCVAGFPTSPFCPQTALSRAIFSDATISCHFCGSASLSSASDFPSSFHTFSKPSAAVFMSILVLSYCPRFTPALVYMS